MARDLRAQFDEVFADPFSADDRRFCFDLWHVPNQYHLLRTPAWQFFSREVYEQLHLQLIAFGQKHLGCHSITPPWLSLYVEGCGQELHADLPHGPWAFVYSLTLQRRKFSGGETLILRPETIDYWSHFEKRQGHSTNIDDLTLRFPPDFNQLLVFDPRIPHGVSEVKGVKEPREARLVIHGWFQNPAPFVRGGLERKVATTARALDRILMLGMENLDTKLSGSLVFNIKVNPNGQVRAVKTLVRSVKDLSEPNSDVGATLEKSIAIALSEGLFPKASAASEIVLPVVFEI